MSDTASRLEAKVTILCEHPSEESLQQARSSWQEAYLAWRSAAPFLLGPAEQLERQIGQWAINETVLDAAVDSPELQRMLEQTEQRGYAAVEYLLFTPSNANDATSLGRRSHLQAITQEITQLTADATQQWQTSFMTAFISAGDGQPYLLPSDALSLAFTEILNATEQMLWTRIGMPSGFFERATKPETLEAWRSQNTCAGFQATLDGIRSALTAGGESSILTLIATKDGLIESKNPALAASISKQINKIERTINRLDELSLEKELKNKPTTLKPLYQQIQQLQDALIEASLVLELDVYGGRKPIPAVQK
jgi:predicted lipoprotein